MPCTARKGLRSWRPEAGLGVRPIRRAPPTTPFWAEGGRPAPQPSPAALVEDSWPRRWGVPPRLAGADFGRPALIPVFAPAPRLAPPVLDAALAGREPGRDLFSRRWLTCTAPLCVGWCAGAGYPCNDEPVAAENPPREEAVEGLLEAWADCGRRRCEVPAEVPGRVDEAERGRKRLRPLPSLLSPPGDDAGCLSVVVPEASRSASSSHNSVWEGVAGLEAGDCQISTGPSGA